MFNISKTAAVVLAAMIAGAPLGASAQENTATVAVPVLGGWEDEANQVDALEQEIRIKELLAKKVKADADLLRAQRDMQAESIRQYDDAKAERIAALENEVAGYRRMIEQLKTSAATQAEQEAFYAEQQAAAERGKQVSGAEFVPPEMKVISTAEGGRARPSATIMTDDGREFTVRQGGGLNGMIVVSIDSGTVTFEKGDRNFVYGEIGLIE